MTNSELAASLEREVKDLKAEIKEEKERADSNYESCERIKRKFEDATARVKELYAALVGVMALITEGKLVRNTSDDPNPDWAMRQMPFVLALAAAEKALAKARGESQTSKPGVSKPSDGHEQG